MNILFTISFFGVAILVPVFVLISKNKRKKEYYSFGLKEAKDILNLVWKKKYTEADQFITQLNGDNSTQTFDYLALRMPIDRLEHWHSSENSAASNLALGVYYLHQAWKSRSSERGSAISREQAQGFFENLEVALGYLMEVPDGSALKAEKYTRLIRLYMGMEQRENMELSFKRATESDPEKLWAYVAYGTAIQPKWGGSEEKVNDFLGELPPRDLIRQVIVLKLHWDGISMGENYFGGDLAALKESALALALKIDEEIKSNPPKSVHRFMLYNYLSCIFMEFKKRRKAVKYLSLAKGNLALYPHGFQ